MQKHLRLQFSRHDRGLSTSAFFAVSVVAIMAIAGLVIDGGAQISAARRAETTAQAAARISTDAWAGSRLAGKPDSNAAIAAGQQYLSQQEMAGNVDVRGSDVVVTTEITVPTTFLSLVGVTQLHAHGSAQAVLRRS
ncbi:MAG: pilus assembly protein TadG-related protein [Propionibacteriaceae bacterium]